MPMKWCPKCKKIPERVDRVFSIVAIWDEAEDDYRPGFKEENEAKLMDKCPECGTEVEELPHAKGAEGSQAT